MIQFSSSIDATTDEKLPHNKDVMTMAGNDAEPDAVYEANLLAWKATGIWPEGTPKSHKARAKREGQKTSTRSKGWGRR